MSPAFNIAEQTALARSARLLLGAGLERDTVLGFLRKGGLGLLHSIQVLSEVTGMPLLNAQKAVQGSRAWQHTFDQDYELQASIEEARRLLRAWSSRQQ